MTEFIDDRIERLPFQTSILYICPRIVERILKQANNANKDQIQGFGLLCHCYLAPFIGAESYENGIVGC